MQVIFLFFLQVFYFLSEHFYIFLIRMRKRPVKILDHPPDLPILRVLFQQGFITLRTLSGILP